MTFLLLFISWWHSYLGIVHIITDYIHEPNACEFFKTLFLFLFLSVSLFFLNLL